MVFCFVLAALNGSTRFDWRQNTYPLAYAPRERIKRSLVYTSSPFRSQRPCRKSILTSLDMWTINEVTR